MIGVLALLAACSQPSKAAEPPARRAPVVVPSAVPSASAEVEEPAPAELIDQEASEQLAMTAVATMTVNAAGKATTITLAQDQQSDTVIEQNAGETQRVLRLATADPKRADDVQFTVEGIAVPGTFPTGGSSKLRVVFFHAPLEVDLLSENGECTVTLYAVDTAGATGLVRCADVATAAGKTQLSATFAVTAVPA